MKDMTKGKPWKLILLFMIPVYIGNLFQTFYNVVDSIIVGRFLGVDALAAVGMTSSISFMVLGWVNGMTSGFSILIAQSFGADDRKCLRHYTAISIYLCTALAIIMPVVLLLANGTILRLMNTPAAIMPDTYGYIAVIYAGLPATIMYNMLAGMSRALGDSRTPLIFLVFSSILNIFLDVLFVAVLPFGVKGAGYATVLAQAFSAILCFFYIRKHYEIYRLERDDWGFLARSAWKLTAMGVPMALQFSITALGVMLVQASLNLLGAVYIAAYSAAIKVQNIVVQLFPSLGMTLATYISQNMGAGKIDRIKKGVRTSLMIELSTAAVCMVIVFFWGADLTSMFVEENRGEVHQIAEQMFHISLWFYPFLGAIFIFRNTLQGMGDGLVPMLGGIFELIARGIAVWLLAAPLGFLGICLTDPAAWLAALVPLVPVYLYQMRKLAGMSKKYAESH